MRLILLVNVESSVSSSDDEVRPSSLFSSIGVSAAVIKAFLTNIRKQKRGKANGIVWSYLESVDR